MGLFAILGLLSPLLPIVNEIAAWISDGLPWRKRERATKSESEPPSPTIPGPTGSFEFTRATTLEAPEWEAVRDVTTQRMKVQPADDLGELMVGDMLTFRVEVTDGREAHPHWIWARAICPRRGSVLAKIHRTADHERLTSRRILKGAWIEVPREALAHVFRITAAGVAT